MRRSWLAALCLASVLFTAGAAGAHPAPFSYLDLHLDAAGVHGTLVVHDLDAAHDLDLEAADSLLDPAVAARFREALVALLAPRLSILFDGRPVSVAWGALSIVADRQSLRLDFAIADARPARATLRAYVFPYDPIHQTFVNVYEDGTLRHQAILDATRQALDFYSGTMQGRASVVRTFIASGVEHILIGPDHILFLIGLLLLGGSLRRLALIVTAFTIGHSVTLSVAALDLFVPPGRFVEPLIALTIVVVGADNLLVLRGSSAPTQASDIRAWLAAVFGLVHGFGFASVLKEFGLPQAALGWSLLAFNLGVEFGQLLIVGVVATGLAAVRRRSAHLGGRVALVGSIGVVVAGLYWFVERVFGTGA